MKIFSFARLSAVIVKEFIQMRRDRATFAMIIGIPLIQLCLFGFAINTNPRNLPTAIVNPDLSDMGRRILVGMENSSYFHFIAPSSTEEEARDLLKRGKVQFIVNFPPNFSHDLVKGLKPSLLLEADATDPAATSRALNVFTELASSVLNEELVGTLKNLSPSSPPYQPVVHAIYNPLAITSYNIVPGLLGVVLTMTMVIITALVLTREFERGTMENLLATPLKPLEVMVGKIIPYIIVGYAQVLMIIILAKFVFNVPMEGNIILLLILCLPFIAANLSVGLTFSTLASNQLQAVQGAMFFFLPSILLSGFMFPFRGMPDWAQWVGNILPLTHFLVIVRGILLKGNGFFEVWREVIPITLFTFIVMALGFSRYRQTLD
ncbi:ABC transporter permease [Legionella hackeliae]|uniref:Export ABC transporter permease protein n=1 Tax=Legionella hackeliae TaxID=449 RepID=A0A0A8US45_LEGHA|nr:ABC transporter permease [Legionella hackeliae]KTD10086.1 ABC transporter permease [Legionella hackeliae]CEK09574.1 Export ABC transporter permease protein [Legionella hackeliae]STX49484.1 ABC transporter permease [Legionella hackeliae]